MHKHAIRAGLALLGLAFIVDPPAEAAAWRIDQVQLLRQYIAAAPDDALPVTDASALDGALLGGMGLALDQAATAAALRLAHMHLMGVASVQEKVGWQITDSDAETDLSGRLRLALATDDLAQFFMQLRPAYPDYAALRNAYAKETDPARRRSLARNMERWRWLPQTLGRDFLLVNAAFFNARLWRNGQQVQSWRVIVGKPSTPTPVFSTQITGVTLNPWWSIPASIVKEKGGRFSAAQGYVYTDGQWRQKPGPNNALGQMKLVMPNAYSVYVHDTPSKALFAKPVRAFSHGCVRIDDALGFATTLLHGIKTRAEIDAAIRSRNSVTFALPKPVPIYITYFTAAPAPDGTIAYMPDIYRRDAKAGIASSSDCPSGVVG